MPYWQNGSDYAGNEMSDPTSIVVLILALSAGFGVVYVVMRLGERYGGTTSALEGSLALPGRLALWLISVWPPNVRVFIATALALASLVVSYLDLRLWGGDFWGLWFVVALVMSVFAGFAGVERRRRQLALLSKLGHGRPALEGLLRLSGRVVVTTPLVLLAAGFILFAIQAIPR
jgi:hypothetical protein